MQVDLPVRLSSNCPKALGHGDADQVLLLRLIVFDADGSDAHTMIGRVEGDLHVGVIVAVGGGPGSTDFRIVDNLIFVYPLDHCGGPGCIYPTRIIIDITEDGGELFNGSGKVHIHTDVVKFGVVRLPAIDVDAILLTFKRPLIPVGRRKKGWQG